MNLRAVYEKLTLNSGGTIVLDPATRKYGIALSPHFNSLI